MKQNLVSIMVMVPEKAIYVMILSRTQKWINFERILLDFTLCVELSPPYTPLHIAAKEAHKILIECLLKYGAEVRVSV